MINSPKKEQRIGKNSPGLLSSFPQRLDCELRCLMLSENELPRSHRERELDRVCFPREKRYDSNYHADECPDAHVIMNIMVEHKQRDKSSSLFFIPRALRHYFEPRRAILDDDGRRSLGS